MTRLLVGGTCIERRSDEFTVTTLADGAEILAVPHDTPEYRRHALELGYLSDTARMSYEHELVHSLLAGWLGMSESPVMRAVADQTWLTDVDGRLAAEEHAVLAIQALCCKLGIDLSALQSGAAGVRPA